MSLINATSSSDIFLQSNCIHDDTSNWSALYRSSLWNNRLRDVLNTPHNKYCNTCRGKIRSYGIIPKAFIPHNHSTPKLDLIKTEHESIKNCSNNSCSLNSIQRKTSINDVTNNRLIQNIPSISQQVDGSCENKYKSTDENCSNNSYSLNSIQIKTSINDVTNNRLIQNIPSISQQVDGSFQNKYRSTEYDIPINISQRRLRKSLKGIGCIVNFSLTESPKKRRTKVQACSIALMIIAIVVISLVLVNFTTPSFVHVNNTSTSIVPIENIYFNETTSAVVSILPNTQNYSNTTESSLFSSTNSIVLVNNIISKVRKNIKTYPKKKIQEIRVVNRDLSSDFCSCQTNQVCMLDEVSGTSICKAALDPEDPTGCGGLCALETEACQLVDKSRGVRICKLLTQAKCKSNDWRCRDGFCVPAQARCDGYIQCYDRSDEMHCDCDLKKQFRCGNSISCFSNKKKCDGFIDCWDGFDEVNCTLECPSDQFTCNDGQCIISSRFCDGLEDCADASDEPQGCGACGTHEVQCHNHRCIPRTALCNGQNDCGDNSDEMHCS